MSACHCEYGEPATIYRATRQIARKPHRCDECGSQIDPGDRYERVTALWDGWRSGYKTCSGCLLLRDHLEATRPCFCWSHNRLIGDIEYELIDATDWKPGERFRALAMVVQVRRERLKGCGDAGRASPTHEIEEAIR